jgi:hypothetical protein
MLLYTEQNSDGNYNLRILESFDLKNNLCRKNIISFKINPKTYLPIINNSELLERLCKMYISSNKIMNLIEKGDDFNG